MKPHIEQLIQNVMSEIDERLCQQVNVILHANPLQRLEASWRGLGMLLKHATGDQQVRIRLLDMSYDELARDVLNAIEFDQSILFKKIYTNELDQPGGEPFGLLIGDYSFAHKPINSQVDGVSVLREIAKVAAASFVPFVSSVDASLFGLDDYAEFQPPLNFESVFQMKEYQRWNAFRRSEDSRFIGLTLPRVIMREPYNEHGMKRKHRFFIEKIARRSDYLWGSASFSYAEIVIVAFMQFGWFSQIQGLSFPEHIAGVATDNRRHYFSVNPHHSCAKPLTEVLMTDDQVNRLSDHGFIALKDHPMSEQAVFYSSHSVQIPRSYDRLVANSNAKLSGMLHYILCVSRFAHYIKVIARDKIGSFLSSQDCEIYLQRWVLRYCATNQQNNDDLKAKYPLNEARVTVREQAGLAGSYQCIMHLKPHFQIDALESQLKLVTPLSMRQG